MRIVINSYKNEIIEIYAQKYQNSIAQDRRQHQ